MGLKSFGVAISLSLFLSAVGAQGDDAVTCPASDASSIQTWRDQLGQTLVNEGSWSVGNQLTSCFHTSIPACFSRIEGAIQTAPSVDYGSIFPDEQKRLPKIFQVDPTQPDQFQIPANLEAIIAGTDSAPANAAGETVDYTQWKVVKYKSRSTGGFDLGSVSPTSRSTESLMLILVPGESFTPPLNYDRWINIGLPSDQGDDRFKPEPQRALPAWTDYTGTNGQYLPVTFTMLTMQKPGDDGTRARILFQNFSRQDGTSPVYRGNPSNPSGCKSCHANGMRAISPLGYFPPGTTPPVLDEGNTWMAPAGTPLGSAIPQLPAETQAKVLEMNTLMSSYGRIDWGTVVEADGVSRTFVDPYSISDTLGSLTPAKTRDDAFLASCMNVQTEYDYTSIRGVETTIKMGNVAPDPARVKAAMNCGGCHGTIRAPIHNEFSRGEVEFKVLIDRSMPMFTQGLTDSDRIALVNCLYAERSANDLAWFTTGAGACTDALLPPPVVTPPPGGGNSSGGTSAQDFSSHMPVHSF